jgi:hypothetical protein
MIDTETGDQLELLASPDRSVDDPIVTRSTMDRVRSVAPGRITRGMRVSIPTTVATVAVCGEAATAVLNE